MTTLTACPVCGTPRPADRMGNEPPRRVTMPSR